MLCLSSLPTESILHILSPPHPARNYSDDYLLRLLRLCDAAGICTSKDYLTAGLAPTPAIFFARFGSW
ncbi:MAG: hypothetical protein ACREQM_19290, partial [Candidatus Dormibacteraceae bacterium]